MAQSTRTTIGKIKTSSGNWFDFTNPDPNTIIIEDVAEALSKICRYNGHIPSFYSVAEHSCYVADWLINHGYRHLAFAGLLHDAAEAYLGDIVNPMKRMPEFQAVYGPMEETVELVIGEAFNVDLYPIDPIVKEADAAVYEWEVENIRSGKHQGLHWKVAYDNFINYFEHYKPGKYFTRESQMINTPDVPHMTDGELDAQDQREKAYTRSLEAALDKAIADLDALSVEWDDETEAVVRSPRREMLENAADLVDGDRNAQYGDPRQDFKRTAQYWNAHLKGVIERKINEQGELVVDDVLDPQDVAIMMSLLKISRLAWDPSKEDTWTDLAGYAACGWHCVVPE